MYIEFSKGTTKKYRCSCGGFCYINWQSKMAADKFEYFKKAHQHCKGRI